jgi:DNA-binding LytR/AlgR family response regulator
MVRIAMVEDDGAYRDQLKEYLERYEKECGESFRISVFTDGAEIAENYKSNYDIILMDIEMRYMDGMTAAERIRQVDAEVVIIFITNMAQYVMKGYTVDAMDYVLKPITYYAFSQRIDRALQRMKRRNKRYIAINHQGGMTKLDVSQITYVEVRDHDLVYHTRKGSFTTKGTLADAQRLLDSKHFFRCNKGYLVNLEYVESVQNYDVQVGDTWLQVSRPKKKALLDALNDYINEVSK